MPTVILPSGMPASIGDVTTAWEETYTLSADTTVNGLNVAYGSHLVFAGSLRLVVDGDLAIDGATVTIPAGAQVDVYVTGATRIGWGATVNTDGEPARLRLHLLGGDGLTIDYGGALTAAIEQPDGAFTNNGGAFSGTWAGASLTMVWGATTHLDASRLCE